jgi:hypothetical protein
MPLKEIDQVSKSIEFKDCNLLVLGDIAERAILTCVNGKITINGDVKKGARVIQKSEGNSAKPIKISMMDMFGADGGSSFIDNLCMESDECWVNGVRVGGSSSEGRGIEIKGSIEDNTKIQSSSFIKANTIGNRALLVAATTIEFISCTAATLNSGTKIVASLIGTRAVINAGTKIEAKTVEAGAILNAGTKIMADKINEGAILNAGVSINGVKTKNSGGCSFTMFSSGDGSKKTYSYPSKQDTKPKTTVSKQDIEKQDIENSFYILQDLLASYPTIKYGAKHFFNQSFPRESEDLLFTFISSVGIGLHGLNYLLNPTFHYSDIFRAMNFGSKLILQDMLDKEIHEKPTDYSSLIGNCGKAMIIQFSLGYAQGYGRENSHYSGAYYAGINTISAASHCISQSEVNDKHEAKSDFAYFTGLSVGALSMAVYFFNTEPVSIASYVLSSSIKVINLAVTGYIIAELSPVEFKLECNNFFEEIVELVGLSETS